jgi:hypothetical protein
MSRFHLAGRPEDDFDRVTSDNDTYRSSLSSEACSTPSRDFETTPVCCTCIGDVPAAATAASDIGAAPVLFVTASDLLAGVSVLGEPADQCPQTAGL